MSYEKTVWHTGDKVTAGKLNKLEDQVEELSEGGSGGGGGVTIVGSTYDSTDYCFILQETAGNIWTAL